MQQRLSSSACLLMVLAGAVSAENHFTLIDYPGASSTLAWGINSRGDIVGYYVGADKNNHGFLWNGDRYTAIDYPGAAVTLVNGINPQGDIVGEFGVTATSPHRGFLLGADGVYTPFDFPGATTTSLVGINARGEISGQYTLADGNRHTFLWAAGNLTKIDYPGATLTGPLGISPHGEVVGAYSLNGVVHGYVYSTGGGFTTIDYPGAPAYTNVTGRNSSGDTVGRYLDAAGVSHGYTLSNGQFTTIDYPGASFTGPSAIDPAGNIAGRCTVNGVNRGFLLATTKPALRYSVTDLGMVGPAPGQPVTLTNNRLVAGLIVTDSLEAHAAVWSGRGMADLGSAGANSMAFGINESGMVVGQTEIDAKDPGGEDFCGSQALGLQASGAPCVPFASQFGTMQTLRTLGGANGVAYAVNSRGQIAGVAENRTVDPVCPAPQKYQFKPVLWRGAEVDELPTVDGDPNGVAYNVNENGDAVGASGGCGPYNTNTGLLLRPSHALLWEPGRVVDLGNLGGKGLLFGHFAHTINNNREVVGYSDITGDRAVHAFRWTKIGGMEDLGTLDGDGHSLGAGINDAGVLAGISASPDFSRIRAFVWRGGVMMDLNQLIPATSPLYLLTACSVNSRGEIIGFSVDSNGNLHGYLAVPVSAGEDDGPLGVSTEALSAKARSRMRSIGLGLADKKVDR